MHDSVMENTEIINELVVSTKNLEENSNHVPLPPKKLPLEPLKIEKPIEKPAEKSAPSTSVEEPEVIDDMEDLQDNIADEPEDEQILEEMDQEPVIEQPKPQKLKLTNKAKSPASHKLTIPRKARESYEQNDSNEGSSGWFDSKSVLLGSVIGFVAGMALVK